MNVLDFYRGMDFLDCLLSRTRIDKTPTCKKAIQFVAQSLC